MKPTIITAFVLVVGIAGVGTYLNQPVDVMNERVDAGMATTTEEVIELDIIEAAKAELERINTQLDEEETRLLEEKKAIDARLEQIRETRTSFQ